MIKINPAWEKSKELRATIWKLYYELIQSISLETNLINYKDDIAKESNSLGEYLFPNNQGLSKKNLKDLLETLTDKDTLEKNKLIFSPNDPSRPDWTVVKRVFDYDTFSERAKFKQLIHLLGVETCPYCNRAFTSTVKKGEKFYRTNQADHYMNKDNYPYLALTLPNLIPVCAACNNHKSARIKPVLYPYKEGFENKYRFVTHPVRGYRYLVGEPGSENDFEVVIEKAPDAITTKEYDERVNASREFFGLDVLYTSHNAYVRRIFEQRYIFGDAYAEDLCRSFPQYFTSKADVREMLYMKSIDENNLGEAPLSKLTADIDAEITRLTSWKTP